VALFNDPAILAAVIAGLVFLVALKVAAFIAVRRVMRPKAAPIKPD